MNNFEYQIFTNAADIAPLREAFDPMVKAKIIYKGEKPAKCKLKMGRAFSFKPDVLDDIFYRNDDYYGETVSLNSPYSKADFNSEELRALRGIRWTTAAHHKSDEELKLIKIINGALPIDGGFGMAYSPDAIERLPAQVIQPKWPGGKGVIAKIYRDVLVDQYDIANVVNACLFRNNRPVFRKAFIGDLEKMYGVGEHDVFPLPAGLDDKSIRDAALSAKGDINGYIKELVASKFGNSKILFDWILMVMENYFILWHLYKSKDGVIRYYHTLKRYWKEAGYIEFMKRHKTRGAWYQADCFNSIPQDCLKEVGCDFIFGGKCLEGNHNSALIEAMFQTPYKEFVASRTAGGNDATAQ